jgi:anion-transporting  ArsA/GET3 family ATPase
LVNLLDKRLLIVTGKGGVGKSVVAASLAHLASRQGKNVLLIEMDTEDRLGDLFETQPVADRIEPLRDNISAIDLDPRTVLEDFFRSHVKIKAVYGPILDSRLFNYFFEAAPALRELVCLGKVWKLVEDRSWWTSRPKWDLIVFDAPATGHGLGLLNVPEAASHILLGPMRGNALKIRDLFRDPSLTSVNVVTSPEEMPVNEAVMIYEGVRGLRMPLGYLFLNQVFSEQLSAEEASELEVLGPGGLEPAARAAFGDGRTHVGLQRAARFEQERAALSAHYRRVIGERIDLPTIEIPFLFTERFGLAEIERTASIIEAGLGAPARVVA